MHFGDKDELFREVCEERFKELNQFFDQVTASDDDPVAQLRGLGRAYFRFGIENPEHYRVLMMTKMQHPHETGEFSVDRAIETEGDRAFMRLVLAVQRCIENGDIRQADPLLVAIALWSGVHGLVSLIIHAPNFPWPEQEELIDFVLDAQIRGMLA